MIRFVVYDSYQCVCDMINTRKYNNINKILYISTRLHNDNRIQLYDKSYRNDRSLHVYTFKSNTTSQLESHVSPVLTRLHTFLFRGFWKTGTMLQASLPRFHIIAFGVVSQLNQISFEYKPSRYEFNFPISCLVLEIFIFKI